VPVEPTDEMEVAAENDYEQTGATFPRWKSAYAAMLNAAPPAPTSHPIPTGATGDAKEWGAAFDAWFIKRGVWPRVNYEEIFAAGWNARAAPAAGDALAYGSPADVAQRIEQYLYHDGRKNSATQLLYEAMKALRGPKLKGEA
ncbi:hypothetical protein, partial [Achromobacter piechaudii]